MSQKKHLFIVALIILCATTPAYAYLDPGSGNVLLQGLLAGTAGVLTVLKIYWQRLTQWFKAIFKKEEQTKRREK